MTTIAEGRAERLRIIAETVQKWRKKVAGKVEPDPEYAYNKPTQYPENVELVSASGKQYDERDRMVAAALKRAGLPVNWTVDEIKEVGLT